MSKVDKLVIDYRSRSIRRPPRQRSLGEELFKLSLLATFFAGYGLEGDPEKFAGFFFVSGLLIWIVVALALIKFCVWRHPRRLITATWLSACVTLLVISLVWFPVSLRFAHACPHGERWANNEVGIARSFNGGPCRNGSRGRGRMACHLTGPWYLYFPTNY